MIDINELKKLLQTQQVKQAAKTLNLKLTFLKCFIKNNHIDVNKIKLDYALESLMPMSGLFTHPEMAAKTGLTLRRVAYICKQYGINSSHPYVQGLKKSTKPIESVNLVKERDIKNQFWSKRGLIGKAGDTIFVTLGKEKSVK